MRTMICFILTFLSATAFAEIVAKKVDVDLQHIKDINANYWKGAVKEDVKLDAQMMVAPRPKVTETQKLQVQAVHDGKWIAFRLTWQDPEKSEAGKLGKFSDAVALQFPVKDNEVPPPFFMGAKGNPVHLFHWRAQYQFDAEHGIKEPKDIYPNMSIDMYPMEFKDAPNIKVSDKKREVYSPGRAMGNPQSYSKTGVDEIMAEGYSTSAVIENTASFGKGEWKDGAWTVVIARALKRSGGSVVTVGGRTHAAFAVWQGGKDEVGSRKSVTVQWTPVSID